ncbi:MAG: imidazole glycerol phosphate synthase, glutamine amidotransferase subunit [Omnitrophica bacterium RIFCSPHIGHO2_02_FULL_63_14]|nr:MAG: imidazole glycerol phosphate synthase, glutamine amidotransferase subunit [Omnitrophica bacterium RIFCSPHIGHO2_02_FULL_63_14]
MKKTIVIVDYGMGNLRSVQKAFEACGARPVITSDPRLVERAAKIVLPGVGAFTAAVRELKKRRLTGVLKKKIRSGTPYLGLCLGLQLLFDGSQESRGKGAAPGLGIIPGRVRRFTTRLKVPHMGWNTLKVKKGRCPLLKGVKARDRFYFVHSYFGVPKDPSWTLAVTPYGGDVCSAVWKGNLFATQFHPEKSQAAGLRVIKNFVDYKEKSAC